MKTFAATLTAILIALASLTSAHAMREGPQAPDRVVQHHHPHAAVLAVQRVRVFTSADSIAAITQASARWGVDYGWLLRVAECESGLNPSAYNSYSGASGLFQFLPGTFWLYAARIGETRSYWNPYASANVAAFMFHEGLAYEWGCN